MEMASKKFKLVEARAFQEDLVPSDLIIEQIYPRRRFLVRLIDFPDWIGEFGHVTDPETGNPARVEKVIWRSKYGQPKGESWANVRVKRNKDHHPVEIHLTQNDNIFAIWKLTR